VFKIKNDHVNKGISSAAAAVLIATISITLVSTTYFLSQGLTETTMAETFEVVDIFQNRIIVRNTGTQPIKSLKTLIDGKEVSNEIKDPPIQPKSIGTVVINITGISSGRHQLTLISKSMSQTWMWEIKEVIITTTTPVITTTPTTTTVPMVGGELEAYIAETEQGIAEIGKPVKWTSRIVFNNPSPIDIINYKVSVLLPEDAWNIVIKDVDKNIIAQNKNSWTMSIAREENISYFVEFETPAPFKDEYVDTVKGWKKTIRVISNASLHYKNVSVNSVISESVKNLRIYLVENEIRRDVTGDISYNVSFVDLNDDGRIDTVFWIVPELSEVLFEIAGEEPGFGIMAEGTLSPILINPPPGEVTNVFVGDEIVMKAEVTCLGGFCGQVNGTARYYNESLQFGLIDTTFETDPFYAISVWEYIYGSEDWAEASGVASDVYDNIIVVGYEKGTADNKDDWRIMKFDSSGNSLWNYTHISDTYDRAYGIANDSNNNIIVVGFQGTNGFDWRIMKFDQNGNSLWNYTYSTVGSKQDVANGVVVDSGDNIIVVGYEVKTTSDWRIMKFDQNGNSLWNYTYDSGDYESAGAVATDSNDNIVVVGAQTGEDGVHSDWRIMKFDQNGNSLWNYTYDSGDKNDWAHGVSVDSNDNIVVVGAQGEQGYTTSNSHIMKFDQDGNSLWNYTHGVNGYWEVPYAVTIDSQNNIIVAGYQAPNFWADMEIIKFSANGNILWDYSLDAGVNENDAAYAVTIDSQNNIIVAGFLGSDRDWRIIKFYPGTNTKSCGILDDGDSCQINWLIPTTEATADYGITWLVDAEFFASPGVDTLDAEIAIYSNPGKLSATLLTPQLEDVTKILQNGLFWINASVDCEQNVPEEEESCGNVTAYTRYNKTEPYSNWPISGIYGTEPFFVNYTMIPYLSDILFHANKSFQDTYYDREKTEAPSRSDFVDWVNNSNIKVAKFVYGDWEILNYSLRLSTAITRINMSFAFGSHGPSVPPVNINKTTYKLSIYNHSSSEWVFADYKEVTFPQTVGSFCEVANLSVPITPDLRDGDIVNISLYMKEIDAWPGAHADTRSATFTCDGEEVSITSDYDWNGAFIWSRIWYYWGAGTPCGLMNPGDTCNVSFLVNATGESAMSWLGKNWLVDVEFDSENPYIESTNTSDAEVNVYPSYGRLNTTLLTPPSGQITPIPQNETFWLNASVTCEGYPDQECGDVFGSGRYNDSSLYPDTLISTTEAKPFYLMTLDAPLNGADSACKPLANNSEPNVGFCMVPTWMEYTSNKLCIDFINTNPLLDGDIAELTNGYDYYIYPDGKVDMDDTSKVSIRVGKECGDSNYEQMADINNDCIIDIKDVYITSGHFGKVGSYIYNLTGVYVAFDTGVNRPLDSNNCTLIPNDASNFTVYNSTDDPVGAMILFYVLYYPPKNPDSCGNLTLSDSCNISWLVNATGDIGLSWFLDTNFSSSSYPLVEDDTLNAQVKIIESEPPQWSNLQHFPTDINSSTYGDVTINVTWTDNTAVDKVFLYHKLNTTGDNPYSSAPMTLIEGDIKNGIWQANVNYDWFADTAKFFWYYSWANDTFNNTAQTSENSDYIEDVTSPQYFDNSTNSTLAGEAVEFRLRWTDNLGLSGYIFSFHNGSNVSKIYDFTDTVNNKAYNNSDTSKPPTSLAPSGETELFPAAYYSIFSSDDSYFTSTSSDHPYHKFNITINESASEITELNVTWEGHSSSGGTVYLYVYNFTSNEWGQILDSDFGEEDFTLTKTFTSGFSDIINAGRVSVLVQDPMETSVVSKDELKIKTESSGSDPSIVYNASADTGSWTNGENAYSSNNQYAETGGQGTHDYYNYDISLSGTINKVEVGGEYYTSGDDIVAISVSWNGGSGWSSEQQLSGKSSDDDTVEWKDFTSATDWDVDKLNNNNFRVRVKHIKSGKTDTVYLDWIPVNISYTPPPYGWLNATWTVGSETNSTVCTEGSPCEHKQYTLFTANATVTCAGEPGDICGSVSGSIRYNDSNDAMTLINITEGGEPFFLVGVKEASDEWYNITVDGSPSERFYSTLDYDAVNDRVILFGGQIATSTPLNDTWLFNLSDNKWYNITESVGPSPSVRDRSWMTYSPVANKFVLFGGYNYTSGVERMSDTWIFNCSDDKWYQANPSNVPTGRQMHTMVYDSGINRVILFGGSSDGLIVLNDTWEFNFTDENWYEITATGGIPKREQFGMAYDSTNNVTILFGGVPEGQAPPTGTDVTWAFNYSDKTWTNLNPLTKPIVRYGTRLVYDSENKRIVLYGGNNGGDETWTYDYSNNVWEQKNPATNPGDGKNLGMTYVSSINNVFLSTGQIGTSRWNETWLYNLTLGNYPAVCDQLIKDEVCPLSWTINATGTPVQYRRIDVNFSSSYGNSIIPDNETDDAIVKISTVGENQVSTDYIKIDVVTNTEFVNDTWNNNGWNSADEWSNVTKTITDERGVTIKWKVYANDTSDYWNVSDTYSFKTMKAWLEVDLTQPSPTNCYDQKPCEYDQYSSLNMISTVKCRTDPPGQSCRQVLGEARYNISDTNMAPINTSIDGIPFYSWDPNPQNCVDTDLRDGETCQLDWDLNVTGALGQANKLDVKFNTSGLQNFTSFAVVKVKIDTTPPQWSENKTYPDSGLEPHQEYQFNVTWKENETDVSTVLIEHNFTGPVEPHNYTTMREGNVSYFNVTDLAAGTYVWREYANNSHGFWNKTDQWIYEVLPNKPPRIWNLTVRKYEDDKPINKSITGRIIIFTVNVSDSNLDYVKGNFTWPNGTIVYENLTESLSSKPYMYNWTYALHPNIPNGTAYINVTAYDKFDLSNSTNTTLEILPTKELVIENDPVNFSTVKPARWVDAVENRGWPLKVIVGGNVPLNVSQMGEEYLTGAAYPSIRIYIRNITWNQTQTGNFSQLSPGFAVVNESISPGKNQPIYYKMYVPPVTPQEYGGSITIKGEETET